ncbi:T-complex protein 1 subunit delta-like [Halichondria panicea]|uniref:T-complex protein 1 subunit delta-like n=1 Tax=Halichondria panicea TaxID=6063 RepID=UPI00312B9842
MKVLVELSKAQDIEAGDGTTSVVVIAGSLLNTSQNLLEKGIHPTTISDSFQKAAVKATEVLTKMSTPVTLDDRESLLKSATTSLNSKVVSQYSSLLAPLSVDAVLKVIDPATATNVDLNNIKLVRKLGGTVEDTELVEGLVLDQKASHLAGGVTRVEKAKIGLIQFCISPPKTDMENQVIVSDYSQMDRILKEERQYILNICKKIKKAGCNVLLIQKSILRALIAGGGAPETEVALRLLEYSQTLSGMEAYCVRGFTDAMEVIPYTLAENAGLNPIGVVTELRKRHANGEKTAGINVRKGTITDILEENVVQPLLVSTSAIQLASETVRSILKIDDILNVLR